MNAVLKTSQLTKTYSSKQVVKELSMTIQQGDIYGFIGKNGAGREDVWELESYYIGQAVADYMLTYSPEKIILWGGVMHQEKVFDMVRQNAVEFLNGYLPETSLPKDMSQYVVAPALGENPGIIGAMCLGMDAYLMECGKNL